MGMFLAMSGVIGKSAKEVIQALQDYTKFKKGTMEEWRGKPETICKFIQGILVKDIENYYKVWDEDDFNEEKAYEEDEFGFGEDWQVVDFMDNLNIIYPFDKENGFPIGKTYKFTIQG